MSNHTELTNLKAMFKQHFKEEVTIHMGENHANCSYQVGVVIEVPTSNVGDMLEALQKTIMSFSGVEEMAREHKIELEKMKEELWKKDKKLEEITKYKIYYNLERAMRGTHDRPIPESRT